MFSRNDRIHLFPVFTFVSMYVFPKSERKHEAASDSGWSGKRHCSLEVSGFSVESRRRKTGTDYVFAYLTSSVDIVESSVKLVESIFPNLKEKCDDVQ